MDAIRWSVLSAVMLAAHAAHAQVQLQNATATYSRSLSPTINWNASKMLDGAVGVDNGWQTIRLISGVNVCNPETAAFETVADLAAPAIRINMLQVHTSTGYVLGRFRWSATTDARGEFCDGLQVNGDVTANWVVLVPRDISVPHNSTFTVLPDHSVLVTGSATAKGSMLLTFDLPASAITGLRLETLEHPDLPDGGPGRSAEGAFHIDELFVSRIPCAPDLTLGNIPGQHGYGVPNAIVNNDDFFYYLSQYAANNLAVADLTTGSIPGRPGYGISNGVLNSDDFFFYLSLFAANC